MLKKIIPVVASTLICSLMISGCGSLKSGNNSSKSGDIKLGAVLPLSGDVSAMGNADKNAVGLLEEQVNSQGGINGRKIKFIFEDDENKPANSANAIQKLISINKVCGVVGSYASKCAISMAPIATASKIPMITLGSNPKITLNGGPFVFTSTFSDDFQGNIIAEAATDDLKAKTAAMLYDVGNDYCKGLSEIFKQNFEKSGGKVVGSFTYNNGDQDFSAQLTKIKALNPDVLLLPDYYGTVALIAKQARNAGIKSTFLGGDGWDSPDLFKIGKDSVNGAYFSNFFSKSDTTPNFVKFKESYEKKYNQTPDATAACAYNAADLMINAIKNAKSTDGDKIRQALVDINITGVPGPEKYDKNRNAVMSGVIIKIENQKQVFIRKVKP